MRPLIDEGPWLDEYGWILAVCYHVVFMVMFTRLVFTKKVSGRSTLPVGGCTTQTGRLNFMKTASQNQAQNFYFSVKYLGWIVDI